MFVSKVFSYTNINRNALKKVENWGKVRTIFQLPKIDEKQQLQFFLSNFLEVYCLFIVCAPIFGTNLNGLSRNSELCTEY